MMLTLYELCLETFSLLQLMSETDQISKEQCSKTSKRWTMSKIIVMYKTELPRCEHNAVQRLKCIKLQNWTVYYWNEYLLHILRLKRHNYVYWVVLPYLVIMYLKNLMIKESDTNHLIWQAYNSSKFSWDIIMWYMVSEA
jgi:hypothetical protein